MSECENVENGFPKCAALSGLEAENALLIDKPANVIIAEQNARIKELEAQLTALKEAAEWYSDQGHHDWCSINYNGRDECSCGLLELKSLLETSDD